jgi:sialic acid synthase SpsE
MKILDFFKKTDLSYKISNPYIIAEAGVNHEGSMDLAKRLIEEAKEGGAHAIKFQTYKADTIASKDSPSYWDLSKEATTSQHALFQKYDKFWKTEYEELKNICDQNEIEFMSTPFDVESAEFLNELMDVIKISSSDISNLPFIEYLCKFKKPIILSTGASYLWEIQRAVEVMQNNNVPYCLMQCILNYPTLDENANLGMLLNIKEKFPEAVLGYSDHTLPKEMEVLKTANLLGAVVLEKHFTHDKTLPGNDHYHAMDKEDLKLFFKKMKEVQTIFGSIEKRPLETEKLSRENARRSLVLKKDIKKGEIFSKENLTWKRPAHGVSPSEYYQVIGRPAAEDINEDTVLKWKMID